jgi:hypothetical protein
VLAAQQVRDLNDYPALHTLQQQLELLQGKQTQLLVEQSDLMKQQQPHSSARFVNYSLNPLGNLFQVHSSSPYPVILLIELLSKYKAVYIGSSRIL